MRYRFRKLDFEYTTMSSTTDAGSFCMAYAPDGDSFHAGTAGGTVSANRELSKSVEFPVWVPQPVILEAVSDRATENPEAGLFYTSVEGTTDADYRQSFQGAFFCSALFTATSPVINGEIYCSGILDLYSPASVTQTGYRRSRRPPQVSPSEETSKPPLSVSIASTPIVISHSEYMDEKKELPVSLRPAAIQRTAALR
jgi:hypothetical protein